MRELQAVPEREYGFKHVLTQEAAYATLLVRRRRQLHRRSAEALEDLYPERVDELHPVLAHHYAAGRGVDRGRTSMRGWRPEAAQAAMPTAKRSSSTARRWRWPSRPDWDRARDSGLFEARAKVYDVLRRVRAVPADYEASLVLAEQAGDGTARSRLLAALGLLWGGHKDYQRALELTRQAAVVAEAAGDQHALAEAGICIGVIRLNLAQTVESRRVLERSLGLFRELRD